MAALHDHLVYRPLAAVRGCVLALLNGAFGENVVALIERQRDIRERVVKRQPMPVCVRFNLLVLALYRYVSPSLAFATFMPEGK